MPRVWNDGAGDIRCGSTGHNRHHRSEGFFAADGQDRHWQRPLGEKSLVVDDILIEGMELLETRVHRARPSIECGVVLTGGFMEVLRIGRELVPETIEIN